MSGGGHRTEWKGSRSPPTPSPRAFETGAEGLTLSTQPSVREVDTGATPPPRIHHLSATRSLFFNESTGKNQKPNPPPRSRRVCVGGNTAQEDQNPLVRHPSPSWHGQKKITVLARPQGFSTFLAARGAQPPRDQTVAQAQDTTSPPTLKEKHSKKLERLLRGGWWRTRELT